jgi:hypothetical protein
LSKGAFHNNFDGLGIVYLLSPLFLHPAVNGTLEAASKVLPSVEDETALCKADRAVVPDTIQESANTTAAAHTQVTTINRYFITDNSSLSLPHLINFLFFFAFGFGRSI